jgi:hypothetical protein
MTEISLQVAPIKAVEANQEFAFWSQQVLSSGGREQYESRTANICLELTPAGSTIGPELYSAAVLTNDKRFKLKGKYLSPGRYGVGYSQFAASPFSHDSEKLALVRVRSAREPAFFGVILEPRSGRQLACLERRRAILHHSWSPTSRYWLSQEMGFWLLWDSTKGGFRSIGAGESFPKHALFLTKDRLLTFDEASGRLVVRQLPDFELLLKDDLPTAGQPAFSFPSRSGDALILGTDISFPDGPEAESWFRVMVTPEPA